MAKKEGKNEHSGRGLHNAALRESFVSGDFKGLLKVVKEDDELIFQIRNNYVNIYYQGGCLAKVKERSIQFDENFFISAETKKDGWNHDQCLKKKKEWLEELNKDKDYEKYVANMKEIMEKHWDWLKNRPNDSRDYSEKNVQQLLCASNKEDSDYTIIDLEFEVSKNSKYGYEKTGNGRVCRENKKPRFDIIAVRNSDKQLCVIELKCGIGALRGDAGLGDHADSFEGTIKRNPKPFVTEIKKIVQDKSDLELLSKGFSISEKAPEFMFAFVASEKETEKQEWDEMLKQMREQNCTMYKVMKLETGGNYRLGNECRL